MIVGFKKYLYVIILFSIFLIFSMFLYGGRQISLTDGIEDNGIFTGYTFADTIIDYNGKELKHYPKEKALNGVLGTGDAMGSLDVFVLGDGNYAVFTWKDKKIVNGKGDDLKIFENGFYVSNNKNIMSLDLATLSISKDGITWIEYPIEYDKNERKNSPEGKIGFIGLTPVYLNMENNFIHPSLEEAGGDGFDLSKADIKEGDYIKYIKIIDSGNNYPDGQVGSNGVDIDGICAFYWINE